MNNLEKDLFKREQEGNLRFLKPAISGIDFCSNDYLGLANSQELKSNITARLTNSAITPGSGAARLISGNYEELEKLESKISEFHNSESALIFSTGYQANLALYSAIGKRGDTIFYDELSHASIKDGIRMSQAKAYSFRHNDLGELNKKLSHAKGNVYIAVESLYSMDGDFAPLTELAGIADKNSYRLIVDEAHSNGLFGQKGEGLVSELGLENSVFARNVTYGKAFGVQGASILGSKVLKEYLINFSRPFIYSTALSPVLAVMIDESYKIILNASQQRKSLFNNISLYREKLGSENSLSPIQQIAISGNSEVKAKAEILQKNGFDIRAVLSPTVPKGKERLRICLHSFNTADEIDSLLKLLSI